MSDPLKENEAAAEVLIAKTCDMFYKMRDAQSIRARPILEKHLRPRFLLALLDARIAEAKRCEAYGWIGSPRVMELEGQRNALTFEIANLEAK